MENEIKQHTLVFGKGITSSPSDLLCDDDSLEVCEGMTVVDGEWKALQKPKEMFGGAEIGGKLMYVHRMESTTNYIVYDEPNSALYIYGNGEPFATLTGEVLDVKAIGKTLVVNTSEGLYYYLWKATNNNYSALGKNIPEPEIKFYISNGIFSIGDIVKFMRVSTKVDNLVALHKSNPLISLKCSDYDDVMNAVIGSYAEAKKKIAEEGKFCHPFFVRYAIELSDGTYFRPSIPVLMLPAFYRNVEFIVEHGDKKDSAGNYYIDTSICARVRYGSLQYSLGTDYSEWSDIVKNIVVFASDDVELVNTSYDDLGSDINKEKIQIDKEDVTIYKGLVSGKYRELSSTSFKFLKERNENEIMDDIKNVSVFYKISEIAPKPSAGNVTIKKGVVSNLTTQTRLVNASNGDDYYSHCSLYPSGMETFNRRLNLYGVKRGFYKGAEQFMPYTQSSISSISEHTYNIKAEINTPSGIKVVSNTFTSDDILSDKIWFYYPDPRATKVCINGHTYDLKEHSGLNGAYYFGGFPTGSEVPLAQGGETLNGNDEPELIENYLIQSEVDNPFTFFASGYVRVGQGNVIGLAGLTTALSQDAYKVATTLAFTTQGIWALQIDAEGKYAQVHPPFSREVCENPKSITMVDNAVFFVSEKGLMCVTGTTEQGVVCVSKQLHDNKEFMEFLRECEIAYDYTDNMLLVYKPAENSAGTVAEGLQGTASQGGTEEAWVYNIDSHVWSKFKGSLDGQFQTAVADYPDYLLQDLTGKVYSLMEEPHRNDDENTYSGRMTSRAMKFEGSLILKSVRQIKHLMNIEGGKAKYGFTIWAKNDIHEEWHELHSTRGKAWRFYQFRYTFADIKATDSFIGTAVITQKKHNDKLR